MVILKIAIVQNISQIVLSLSSFFIKLQARDHEMIDDDTALILLPEHTNHSIILLLSVVIYVCFQE